MQNYGLLDSPSFITDSDNTSDDDTDNGYRGMQQIPNIPVPKYRIKPNNIFGRSNNVAKGNSLKQYLQKIKHPLVTSTPLTDSFSSQFSINLTPIKRKRNSVVTEHLVDYKQRVSTSKVKRKSNHRIDDKRKSMRVRKSSSRKNSKLSEENGLEGIEPLNEITDDFTQTKITNKLSLEPKLSSITNKPYPQNSTSKMKDIRKSIQLILDSFDDSLASTVMSSPKNNFKISDCEHQIPINEKKPSMNSESERSKTVFQVPCSRVLRSTSRLLSITSDNSKTQNASETQPKIDTSNKKKVEKARKTSTHKKVDVSVIKKPTTRKNSQKTKLKINNNTLQGTIREDPSLNVVPIIGENNEQSNASCMAEALLSSLIEKNRTSLVDSTKTTSRNYNKMNTQSNVLQITSEANENIEPSKNITSIIENHVTTNTVNNTGSTRQRQSRKTKPKINNSKPQDTVNEDQYDILPSFNDVPITEENNEPNEQSVLSMPKLGNCIEKNKTDLADSTKTTPINDKNLKTQSNVSQIVSEANTTIESTRNQDVTLTKTRKTVKEKPVRRFLRSNSHISIVDSIIENNVAVNTSNETISTFKKPSLKAKPKINNPKLQDTIQKDQNESFKDVPITEENNEQSNVLCMPEASLSNSIEKNKTDLADTTKTMQTKFEANTSTEPTRNNDVTLTETSKAIEIQQKTIEMPDETLSNSTCMHVNVEKNDVIKEVNTRRTRKRKSDESPKLPTIILKETNATINNNGEVNNIEKKNSSLIDTIATKKKKLDDQNAETTVNARSHKKDDAKENVPEITQMEEIDGSVTETPKRNRKSKAHQKAATGREKNIQITKNKKNHRITENKVVPIELQQYVVSQNYSGFIEVHNNSSLQSSSETIRSDGRLRRNIKPPKAYIQASYFSSANLKKILRKPSNRSRSKRKTDESTSNNNTTNAKNLEELEVLPEVEENHTNLLMVSVSTNNDTHTVTSNVSALSKSEDDKLFVKPKQLPKKKSKSKSKSSTLKRSATSLDIPQNDTVLHSSLAFDGIDSVNNAGICDNNQTSTSNDCTLTNTMSSEYKADPAELNRIIIHQNEVIPPTQHVDKRDIKKLRFDKNSNFNDVTNESVNTEKKSSKEIIQGVVNNKAVLLEWYSDDVRLDESENVNLVYSLTNLKSHMGTAACGYIVFGPGQEKSQVPRKHVILFKIEKGRALVTQQFVTKVMEGNISFYIPLGSPYKIKNLSDTESLILYFMKFSEL